MNRELEMAVDTRTIVTATVNFKDWNGDAESWREAFFQLLSWKNTWSGVLELTINSTWEHVPYLYVVVTKDRITEKSLRNVLEGFGYTNIKIFVTKARFFSPTWIDEWEDDWENGITDYFIEG